jgi:hypothetical protein
MIEKPWKCSRCPRQDRGYDRPNSVWVVGDPREVVCTDCQDEEQAERVYFIERGLFDGLIRVTIRGAVRCMLCGTRVEDQSTDGPLVCVPCCLGQRQDGEKKSDADYAAQRRRYCEFLKEHASQKDYEDHLARIAKAEVMPNIIVDSLLVVPVNPEDVLVIPIK